MAKPPVARGGDLPATTDAYGLPAGTSTEEEDENLYHLPKIRRSIRRWTMVGFTTIFVFFGGFVGWAAIAPLDSAAVAPGQVSVLHSRQAVQHLEGGIIREILARDGDLVEAGEVVILLDDTQPKASLELLSKRYRALLALEARLIAERDKIGEVKFPKELVESQAEDVAELIQGQAAVFKARTNARESQISILKQRIEQSKEQIQGYQAQQAARAEQLKLIDEEVSTVKKLLETGNALKPRLLALQRARAEIAGQRGDLVANIARVKQMMGETELQMLNIDTEFHRTVTLELRDTQTQLQETIERVRVAQDVLARTKVRSPASGEVVNLKYFTPGAVLRSGDVIMEVVPTEDVRIVEAQVNPNDIDAVRVGEDARVRFSAFNMKTTPQLDGKVIQLSADRIQNPQTGLYYYGAKVAIPIESFRESGLDPSQLTPGMPATVMIWTGRRTALGYFVAPIKDAIATAFREE